ncbi:MAG: hypothetical protein ABFS45_25565, partial [Pseudomonadota bacterium]
PSPMGVFGLNERKVKVIQNAEPHPGKVLLGFWNLLQESWLEYLARKSHQPAGARSGGMLRWSHPGPP